MRKVSVCTVPCTQSLRRHLRLRGHWRPLGQAEHCVREAGPDMIAADAFLLQATVAATQFGERLQFGRGQVTDLAAEGPGL